MKTTIAILTLTILISACRKELQNADNQVSIQKENQASKQPPPPNANPAFAFRGQYYISKTASVPALYVMDVNGANTTIVYTNYTSQPGKTITSQYPDYPSWNSDASKLCFTLNDVDIYILNIAVVNGVATGSGATKIGDGVAAGGSYKQSKWRPGQNQVASVFKKSGNPDEIRLLSTNGGPATILHTVPGTDWIIEDDIAFKSDGSNLVFSERQISTGYVFLKVINVNTSIIIKSIDLSQYKSVREIDWAKTTGSNLVAITTVPKCDGTTIGNNGIHQLQTIDVSAVTPTLTWIKNDIGCLSFSPDDLKITINSDLLRVSKVGGSCSASVYGGIAIYTFATNSFTSFPVIQGGYSHAEWKR